MSVDQKDVIDFVGRSRSNGDVILTIADHLDWAQPREHLFLLKEKIEAYLNFIGTGRLAAHHPDAEENNIIIQVMFRCAPPPGEPTRFLAAAKEQVAAAGCHFTYAVPDLPPDLAPEAPTEE